MFNNRKNDRLARCSPLRVESLERKDLLSVLINAAPTLHVSLNPPRVTNYPHGRGEISILQPTTVTVTGTAQPAAANDTVRVDFFAEDRNGQLVNGGLPVGTTTPDFLGRYSAQVTLPSTVRKDVNFLVARETVTGTITSDLVINPTTLSGLTGDLAVNGTTFSGLNSNLTVNPTTLSGLNHSLTINGTTLSNLSGTVALNPSTFSGLTANVNNPGSVSTVALAPGTTVTGSVNNPPTVSTLLVGATPGTADNPASVSTLNGTLGASAGTSTNLATTSTLNQTGTAAIAGTSGTTTQTGTAAIAGTTGTGTQTGTAAIAGTTGTSTQNGTAAIAPTTGTFTQTGTAAIAGTTGTSTMNISEVAVSQPVVIHIHQPRVQVVRRFEAAHTHPTGLWHCAFPQEVK